MLPDGALGLPLRLGGWLKPSDHYAFSVQHAKENRLTPSNAESNPSLCSYPKHQQPPMPNYHQR
uniref:Uncharacterized protein n=1 Tax=Arundo donax TaxID=35708 RepID=A0A0A9ED93_ARUDO